MYLKEAIKFKKLTKKQWHILKMASPYMDLHHCYGKQTDHLCLLQPIKHEKHIHNHSRYVFFNKIPRRLKLNNLRYWKNVLEQYEYEDFKQQGLLWI